MIEIGHFPCRTTCRVSGHLNVARPLKAGDIGDRLTSVASATVELIEEADSIVANATRTTYSRLVPALKGRAKLKRR